MRCRQCDSEMNVSIENYKYDASGLDNWTLEGIEVRHCPKCGEREAIIPRLDDLHRMIEVALAVKRERLLPKEIRFLRKGLGLSSSEFAKKIGVDPATVSRWESVENPTAMGTPAERLLRLLVIHSEPVQSYALEDMAVEEPTPKGLPRRIAYTPNGWTPGVTETSLRV